MPFACLITETTDYENEDDYIANVLLLLKREELVLQEEHYKMTGANRLVKMQ